MYVHANGREPQEVLDRALEFWEQGFRHIRCQIGGYEGVEAGRVGSAAGSLAAPARPSSMPARSCTECRCCSSTSVPGYRRRRELLHDIHERMAPIDAVRLAKALEPYRLFFLEDPLAPEDLG